MLYLFRYALFQSYSQKDYSSIICCSIPWHVLVRFQHCWQKYLSSTEYYFYFSHFFSLLNISWKNTVFTHYFAIVSLIHIIIDTRFLLASHHYSNNWSLTSSMCTYLFTCKLVLIQPEACTHHCRPLSFFFYNSLSSIQLISCGKVPFQLELN